MTRRLVVAAVVVCGIAALLSHPAPAREREIRAAREPWFRREWVMFLVIAWFAGSFTGLAILFARLHLSWIASAVYLTGMCAFVIVTTVRFMLWWAGPEIINTGE